MKAVLKVLLWLGLGGGIGYFAGYNVADNRRDKELAECCNDCQHNCDNCEAMQLYKEAQKEIQEESVKKEKAESARNEYAGGNAINYSKSHGDSWSGRSDGELAYTEEEPEMPKEEDVKIGDEDIIGNDPAPVIEIINEEEYYMADGMMQENLLFYTVDKRIWNQDTQSEVDGDEILRSLGSVDGDGVGRTYFWRDANGDIPGEKYIRNNMLGCKFKIDRIDARYDDEHD